MVGPIRNRKILLFLWNENKTNYLFFLYPQRSHFHGWRGKNDGERNSHEYWNSPVDVWDLQNFCKLECG